ncbi:hypothetical protein ColTof4_01455 [Colletotrichum tofieldiae]|nr:hypothetical protein ColTof4_01455 [Colletotrichum tofieldiae]GKT96899.1 hypothetical protein Ct61P_14749 [Colletotrichum tofieldiae]
MLLNSTTWVSGEWLDYALGEVCLTQDSDFYYVDSCEVGKMTSSPKDNGASESEYRPRNDSVTFGPAGVVQSCLVMLPVSVSGTHWVLGTITKSEAVAVGINDSLPSPRNLRLS